MPQANKYEFEFTNASLGYSHTIQSNNYHRYLNWTTNPLVAGQTYNVRVRASRDGGVSFCPWGDVCTVTIAAAAQGGSSSMMVQDDDVEFNLWPNPSTGDQVALSVNGLVGPTTDIELTVIDGMGRLVHQRSISTEGPQWQGDLQFPSTLPTGQYFLRYRIGDTMRTQRFVVTH